jgi:hypothetical protein
MLILLVADDEAHPASRMSSLYVRPVQPTVAARAFLSFTVK